MDVALPVARAEIPVQAFLGWRAMNVQSYIESNVKLGLLWEFTSLNNSLAASAKQYLVMRTTSKKVIIKIRNITFTGTGIIAKVYKAPTFSGGSAAAFFNLRQDGGAQPSTVTLTSGVTVSNVGTEVAAATYGIGGDGNGQTTISTQTAEGVERILDDNEYYLLEIQNTDTVARRVATQVIWFEGEPDLPAIE